MCKQILFLILFSVSLTLKGQQFVDTTNTFPTKAWGFINLHDKAKNIPAMYRSVSNFTEGLAAVCKGEKWGYIDLNNQMVIDFQFDYARSFNHGRAIVQQGDRYGVINKKGEFVISPQYYDLQSYEVELKQYYISRDSTFFQGIIDTNGTEILAHQYTFIITYNPSLSKEGTYRNIPFYATFQSIDTLKGSFYEQFTQNAFRFSPEKGRQDIYDLQFNKLASRNSTNYTEGFQHQELLRIDHFLEKNNNLSTPEKIKGINNLLESTKTAKLDARSLDTVKLKYRAKSPDEIKDYLAGLGFTLFTNSKGKTGLKKERTVLIPAKYTSLKLFNIPITNPLEEDIIYLKKHYAGASRMMESNIFDLYFIVADEGHKAYLYSLSGEKILTLTKHKKYFAGTSKIGFKYREIINDTERFGLVNWAADEVLPGTYDAVEVLQDGHLLVKQEKKAKDLRQKHVGLFTKNGNSLVPLGVYSALTPFAARKGLYLATRIEPTNSLQKNKTGSTGNKTYEILQIEQDTYTIIKQLKAIQISTWSLAPQTGMLPFQQYLQGPENKR